MFSANTTKVVVLTILIPSTACTAFGGERFLLGPPGDGDPVCSILVPTGWFPEASSKATDRQYRFVFSPIKGAAPMIILDVDESIDPKGLQDSWQQELETARLLESQVTGRKFYDTDRRMVWSMDTNDRATSVSVSVARKRLYRFRFVDNARATSAFLGTVQEIMDSCDFNAKLMPGPPASRSLLVEQFRDAEVIPFTLNYQDLMGISGLEWKLGLVVGVGLLLLAATERFLRARKDAQRIAAAEAAIEMRQEAELSGGGMRQSLADAVERKKSVPQRRRRRARKVPG